MFYCDCLFWWVGIGVGRGDCSKWVGLHVTALKMKIYSYFHVNKNPYSLHVSKNLDPFQVLEEWNLFNLATTGLERYQIIKYSIYQMVPLMT